MSSCWPEFDERALSALIALAGEEGRKEAGQILARMLGAEDLILFVQDREVDLFLPASGFPQNLRGGPAWRSFISATLREGRHTAELDVGDTRRTIRGVTCGDSVLALIGGNPREGAVDSVCPFLPLLTPTLRAQYVLQTMAGQAAVAHRAEAQARQLSANLEAARQALQSALATAEQSLQVAEEASRSKDEFLATLSHELRTPLNAIVGWAHMLRAGGLDPAATRRAVETISRNAMLQNQLISDLLDIQRITSGKLSLSLQTTDLTSPIQGAIDTMGPAAMAKDIELRSLLDPDAGPISGDPARLQQIVWNLVSNAIKFTPKGGRVEVRLIRINSHVEISVTDNGPGIDAEFLPHVFERFRQGGSTSAREQGLGLGLAIVRSLVELHGGRVSAMNRSPESGAIFSVALPRLGMGAEKAVFVQGRIARKSPDVRDDVWLEQAPSLHDLRVLVIDDQADARELVALALSRCGADVSTAKDAAEGLLLFKRERPDVVVSDIDMPEEDGYSLMEKVRSLSRDRGGLTPAVALTAYAGPQDRLRALKAGFQVHVPKPVQPAELVAVIASLAGISRTT